MTPASLMLAQATLDSLAARATYEGSVQHKDTPSFVGQPDPRSGATHVDAPGESADCMLCPTKWAQKKDVATDLLRLAIKQGQFSAAAGTALPKIVWARDPTDRRIVYEARRLSSPATGYKAYPLTAAQVRALRIDV
jgi:hypothetical protein